MSSFRIRLPHEVLGIANNASDETIRAAYKAIALQVHPDKADEAAREAATKVFQQLQAAYEHCLFHAHVEVSTTLPTTQESNPGDGTSSNPAHPRGEYEARWKGNFDAPSVPYSHASQQDPSMLGSGLHYADPENWSGKIPTKTWRDGQKEWRNARITPQKRLMLFKRQMEALEKRVDTFGLEHKPQYPKDRQAERRQATAERLIEAVEVAKVITTAKKMADPNSRDLQDAEGASVALAVSSHVSQPQPSPLLAQLRSASSVERKSSSAFEKKKKIAARRKEKRLQAVEKALARSAKRAVTIQSKPKPESTSDAPVLEDVEEYGTPVERTVPLSFYYKDGYEE